MIKNKAVNRLCAKAINLVQNSDNFIHNIEHIKNVYVNAKRLHSFHPDADLRLIKIGCYWHDAGRDDLKGETELQRHENVSAKKLATEFEKIPAEESEKKKLTKIILSHRNRRSLIKPLSIEAKILWDADKLDIFNLKRLKNIFRSYQEGKFSKEFNYFESFNFYQSIDGNFVNKFYLTESKRMFKKLYPGFSAFIKRKKAYIYRFEKKAVLVGGGDMLSKKHDKVNKFILSLVDKPEIKIFYIPVALVQSQTTKAIEKYVSFLKKHYEYLTKKTISIDIDSVETLKDSFIRLAEKADILYVAGGDTQYLINYFKKYKLGKIIKNNLNKGKVIVGNSAGALSLAQSGASIFGKPEIYHGLGVIKNIVPIVHFSNNKKNELRKIFSRSYLAKTVNLKENEACVIFGKQVFTI